MTHTTTKQIGEAEVTVLTDGAFAFPEALFPGSDPAHLKELLDKAGESEIRTNFNAVLIRTGGKTILIDAGPRDLMGPTAGNLPAALAEVRVAPKDVDRIFITHLHPDHIAGTITADGAAVFPNAELAVNRDERRFWSDDGNFSGADENVTGWQQLAKAVLAAYGDRIVPLQGEAEIAPGLTIMPLPGHTPGHCGWRLESDGQVLIHVGDIVHAPALQIPDPEIGIGFDIDMDAARETRKRLLDRLASEDALFTGGHLLQPAFARVKRSRSGYELVQA
jgi:glyoxylase-like metal-dependent hydrolase (beta-lactamase superfamily II)